VQRVLKVAPPSVEYWNNDTGRAADAVNGHRSGAATKAAAVKSLFVISHLLGKHTSRHYQSKPRATFLYPKEINQLQDSPEWYPGLVVKESDTLNHSTEPSLTIFLQDLRYLEKNQREKPCAAPVKKTDTRDRPAFLADRTPARVRAQAPQISRARWAALEGGLAGWLGSTQLFPRIPSRNSYAQSQRGVAY
jgi:hypothetical protein